MRSKWFLVIFILLVILKSNVIFASSSVPTDTSDPYEGLNENDKDLLRSVELEKNKIDQDSSLSNADKIYLKKFLDKEASKYLNEGKAISSGMSLENQLSIPKEVELNDGTKLQNFKDLNLKDGVMSFNEIGQIQTDSFLLQDVGQGSMSTSDSGNFNSELTYFKLKSISNNTLIRLVNPLDRTQNISIFLNLSQEIEYRYNKTLGKLEILMPKNSFINISKSNDIYIY